MPKLSAKSIQYLLEDPDNTVLVKIDNSFKPVTVIEVGDTYYSLMHVDLEGIIHEFIIPKETLDDNHTDNVGHVLTIKNIKGNDVDVQISRPINFRIYSTEHD